MFQLLSLTEAVSKMQKWIENHSAEWKHRLNRSPIASIQFNVYSLFVSKVCFWQNITWMSLCEAGSADLTSKQEIINHICQNHIPKKKKITLFYLNLQNPENILLDWHFLPAWEQVITATSMTSSVYSCQKALAQPGPDAGHARPYALPQSLEAVLPSVFLDSATL